MNAIQKLNKEQSKELFFQLEVPLHILDTIATNQKGNLKERKGKRKRKIYYVQAWFDSDGCQLGETCGWPQDDWS